MKSVANGKGSKARRTSGRQRSPGDPLTLQDAAADFGVSVRTLQRFRADGRLPGVRLGRCLVVRREDVERALGWKDPTWLLRKLLSTDDRSSLEAWMDGWKQLTRITATAAAAAEAWTAWANAAADRYPGFRVGDYRVSHLLKAADDVPRHDHVECMVHSMRQFQDDVIVRDALKSFFSSVAPWTRA